MQGRLEVLALASIKRRKPWPQIRWMGLDSENLLLLDERRASVLFLPSGRTRRRVPRLHPLLPRVVAMAPSRNGAWLAGVLVSGELFLWHKDTDSLKTAPAHPAVLALTSSAGEQGSTARLWVLPSDEGRRVLLGGSPDGPLLWELRGVEGPPHAVPGSLLLGHWAQLPPPSDVPLPGAADKEAAAHAVFFTDPELGDCCLCSFVFSAGESLIMSSLLLRWLDGSDALFSVAPFSATWHGFACALGSLSPACEAVKSRGAYVARLSSEGHVLAIAVNQRHPQATQVLFTSATGGVSVSSHLQGCGFRGPTLLPKFIRSYWVSDASWLSGDALLACMLKRGALLLVSRLGEPLSLSTHGCSVEFGPALFIPLHPLVTYSASGSADATASHGSAASEADALRQRFSVSAHPRLPFLLASDGYVVTVMRLGGELASARLVQAALEDVHRTLEDVRIGLAASRLPGEAVLLRSLSVLGAPPPDETVTADAAAAPPPLPPPPFLQQDPDEWPYRGHRALQGDDLYDDLSDEEEGGAGDAGGGGGPDPHPYVRMEHGRVEFAGMHEESRTAEGEMELTAAGGTITGGADLSARLSFAQRRLLVAWHLLLTLRDVDFWDTWMTFTVKCVARLSVLLQFSDRPRGSAGPAGRAASRSMRRDPWPFAVLQLFRRCALVLCWPGEPLPLSLHCSHRRRRHRRALPYGARLSLEVAAALLGGRADTGDTRSRLRSLLAALSLLSFAEAWLDRACGLVLAPAPDPPVHPPLPEPCLAPPVEPPGEDDEVPAEVAMEEAMADSVREGLGTGAELYALCHAPAAADRRVAPTFSRRVTVVGPEWLRSVLHLPARSAGRESSRPAHRLVTCWRLLYRHVLQFQQQLQWRHGADDCDDGAAQERLVASRIAAAVQAHLQCVDGSFPRQKPLLDIAGEELYLSGSYHEAVHTWRRAVLEETDSGGRRGAHLQTRHCLSLLYAHLRALHLLPALCLCDRMAARLLHPHTDTAPGICERAALAVVRSMGRFMAAYFTNRALYVFPPHSVQTLPPLHTTAAPSPRWRLLPVSRAGVSASARAQRVSSAWSPEYALELLLVAGLHTEAVWLARTLGDWKTAVAVGLAYRSHDHHHHHHSRHLHRRHNGSLAGADPAGPPWASLQLPDDLRPARILQEKLQALLQTPLTAPQMDPDGARAADGTAGTASDSAAGAAAGAADEEGEDDAPDALLAALREMLHAAAMAGVDALGPALAGAVEAARERAGGGCLAGLVPPGLYLPAPPLYCPQLGVELQEGEDAALAQEKRSRHGASSALQRALALLRASRCSLPAAQWYIRRLQRVRRTVGKIRAKEGRPPPKPLPPSLLVYTRMRGVALERAGAEGQGTTARVLGCFRELCALCFLLHMRDRLSECCRKYQAARDSLHTVQQERGSVFAFDGAVTAQCEAALAWACRLLPFARFLHAEELLQDLVLSLVAELPPTRQMAEILAQAFPDAEVVRVPLQDKHRSLLKRLRYVNVQDAEEGSAEQQSVSLCLDEQQERRDRFLARVARTMGTVLAHIWEPASNNDHGDDYDDASVSAARFRPLLRSGSADSESAGNADEPPAAAAAALGAPDPDASRKRPAVRCFSDSLVRHGTVPGRGLSGSKAPLPASSPTSAGATTPVAAAEPLGKTRVRKGLSLDERVGAGGRRRRASGGDSKSPFRDEWSDSGSRVVAGNAGTDPVHGTGREGAAAAAAAAASAAASLPPVGSWEFELEDDEYLDFLDLFLGYMLERDLAGGAGQDGGAADSVPLLAPFTELLRRRELTSLAFEAQAMLKRWVERHGGAHRPLARTNSLPAARERKRGRAIAGTGGAAAALDEKPPFEAGTLYPALASLYAELRPESGTSGNRSRVSWSAGTAQEHPVPRAAGAAEVGLEAPFARVGPFGPPPPKLFQVAWSKPALLAGETVRKGPTGGLFWARRQAQADAGRLPVDESEGLWLESSSAGGWGRHPRLTHAAGKSPEGAAGLQEVRERMGSAEGKLLEWMVRWADRRRATPGHRAKGGDGAVMRVRTSTAALLTSLWLLERRHGLRPAASPAQQDTVVGSARVKVGVAQRSSEKGGSTDTGYHGSSDTPPPPPLAAAQRVALARHKSAGPVLGPRTQVATVHPALGEEEEDRATPIAAAAGDELETSDSDVDDVRDSRDDDDDDQQLGPHGRGRDEPRDESSGEGSRPESPTSLWSPTASVVKPCRKSSLSFLREEDPGLQLGPLHQQQQEGSSSRTDPSLRAAPTDGESMASLHGESRARAAGELGRGRGGSSHAERPHAAADAGSGSSRVAFMEEVQRFAQTQQHNFISMMQAVAMSLPGFMSSDQSRHPPPPPPVPPPPSPPSPPHSHHDHADHDRYHHSRTHHDQTYRGNVHHDRGNHDHTQRDRNHHDRASHDSNYHDETHREHTHTSYRQQPPTPPPVSAPPPVPPPPPLPADRPTALPAVPLGNGSLLGGRAAQGPLEPGGQAGSATCLSDHGTIELSRPLVLEDLDAPGLDFARSAAAMSASELALPLLTLSGESQRALPAQLGQPSLSLPPIAVEPEAAGLTTPALSGMPLLTLPPQSALPTFLPPPPLPLFIKSGAGLAFAGVPTLRAAPPSRPATAWPPSGHHGRPQPHAAAPHAAAAPPPPPAASPAPPTHLDLSQYDPHSLQEAREQQARRSQRRPDVAHAHLNLDLYELSGAPRDGAAPFSPPRRAATAGAAGPTAPAPGPAFPVASGQGAAAAAAAASAWPLLGFEPSLPPATSYQTAHLTYGEPPPPPPPTVNLMLPPMAVPNAAGQTLALPLLHLPALPPVASPARAPSPPRSVPHLIPLSQLQGIQNGGLPPENIGSSGLQLIYTAPPNERDARRRRRRAEETDPDTSNKRPSVSFRPEESIIPTEGQPRTREESQQTEVDLDGDGYVIRAGAFRDMLARQDVLRGAVPSSAELHLFASTSKNAASMRHAATNTTTTDDSRPVLAGHILPPDVVFGLRYPDRQGGAPASTAPHSQPSEQVELAHRFINVVDIDDDQLRDLPVAGAASAGEAARPAAASAAATLPEPSSAELHLLAASVVNAVQPVPGRERQPSPSRGDRLTGRLLLLQEDRPTAARPPAPPAEQREGAGDAGPVRGPGGPGGLGGAHGRAAARLRHMDAQLAALQRVAHSVEADFRSAHLLVDTIEQLGGVVLPKDPEVTAGRHAPWRGPSTDRELGQTGGWAAPSQWELDVDEAENGHRPSSGTSVDVLGRDVPSPTLPDAGDGELIYGVDRDEELRWSGLTGVSDIIADVVRDGGAADMGLSPSQAQRIVAESAARAAGRLPQEDERRRLREWMKQRRLQQLAEYRRERAGLRDRERAPFTSASSKPPAADGKPLKLSLKEKEERDRLTRAQHAERRAEDARVLMGQLLSETAPTPSRRSGAPAPTARARSLTPTRGAVDAFRSRSSSSGGDRPSAHGAVRRGTPAGPRQTPAAVRPRSASAGRTRQPPPATARPRAVSFSSRVATAAGGRPPRRGELGATRTLRSAEERGRSASSAAAPLRPALKQPMQSPPHHAAATALRRPGSGGRAQSPLRAGRGGELPAADGRWDGRRREDGARMVEERWRTTGEGGVVGDSAELSAMSNWSVPDDVLRLLDRDDSGSLLGVPGLPEDRDTDLEALNVRAGRARNAAAAGEEGGDDDNDVSQSTGSILCNTDWGAVDYMLASLQHHA
uniref:Ciliogenesis and planar polarity effector 1-like n=1 Tax=Petromyzon marinus TaxID=7757 RepID=A0AAJ7U1C9_PETMA|nr:ciliogenesis and planar polarity effector 1-like [Petromyzon marinus]